jgi:hypothetical protein
MDIWFTFLPGRTWSGLLKQLDFDTNIYYP